MPTPGTNNVELLFSSRQYLQDETYLQHVVDHCYRANFTVRYASYRRQSGSTSPQEYMQDHTPGRDL